LRQVKARLGALGRAWPGAGTGSVPHRRERGRWCAHPCRSAI